MTDIDFLQCDFIDKNMCYVNYFDFCDNCYAIKSLYAELDHNAKRFYKWYVYANIHMLENFKTAIWNLLNVDDPEAYINLISKRHIYKII